MPPVPSGRSPALHSLVKKDGIGRAQKCRNCKKKKAWRDGNEDQPIKAEIEDFDTYIEMIGAAYNHIYNDLDDGLERFKAQFNRRLQASKDGLFSMIPPDTRLTRSQKQVDEIFNHVMPMVVNLVEMAEFHMASTKAMLEKFPEVERFQAVLVKRQVRDVFKAWSTKVKAEAAEEKERMSRPEVLVLVKKLDIKLMKTWLQKWRGVVRANKV